MNRLKMMTIAAVACGLTMAGAAQAAEVVVLDSTVADIPPGGIFPEATGIVIPADETVTLVMASGETRSVVGPYSGPIGNATANVDTTASLTVSRGSDTKVLGAIRAPSWEVTD